MVDIVALIAAELEKRFEMKFSEILSEIQKLKSPQSEQANVYWSRKTVALYIGVSIPTIISYTKRQYLTAYRIGNKIRYKKHEVEGAVKRIQTTIKGRREEYIK